MMIPGVIYLIVNNYLPMFGITIAFKNLDYTKGIFKSDWVGLKNFEFLFKTKDFYIIMRNTLCYNLVFIFGGLAASLAIARYDDGNRQLENRQGHSACHLLPQHGLHPSLLHTWFMGFWAATAGLTTPCCTKTASPGIPSLNTGPIS